MILLGSLFSNCNIQSTADLLSLPSEVRQLYIGCLLCNKTRRQDLLIHRLITQPDRVYRVAKLSG